MTARWMVGVLMGATLVLAGCGTKSGSHLIDFNAGGNRIQEKKAGEDGRYTLHVHGQPSVTYVVAKGQSLGFRKSGEGNVQAYAGDNPAIELQRDEARGAYWRFDSKLSK